MQDWKIKKIVFALSPLMFGVYLAHMDAYIFSNHIKPICLSLLAPSGKANFFVIIIAGLMIFGAGCTMAYLQKTFFTIVRADSLAKWIANKWNLLTQKITSLLFCRQ